MADQPTARTLYDDWQLRRERLLSASAVHPLPYRDVQVQILDYLLSRYRDSADAAQPVRFPATGAVWFNQRAIVVNHHLGSEVVSGIKTPAQARDRVASIVKRLTTGGESSEPARIRLFGLDSGHTEVALAREQIGAAQSVRWKLKPPIYPTSIHSAIAAANKLHAPLPREALEYLFESTRAASPEDLDVVKLLIDCQNRSAAGYAVLAWRDRVVAGGGRDPVTEHLRAFFVQPDVRNKVGDRIRAQLASDSAAVRMEAVSILGDMAVLDDVGLLADLLSLPAQPDEDPRERDELISAMRKIAKMTDSLSR